MGYRARIEEFVVDPEEVKVRVKEPHSSASLIGKMKPDEKWRMRTFRREDGVVDYLRYMVGYYDVDLARYKYGRILSTEPSDFLVIDSIGCSPSADWSMGQLSGGTDIHVNLYINTTQIFYSPYDGLPVPGISGLVAPYPESHMVRRQFSLKPEIYVLPGQNWGMYLRYKNIKFSMKCPEENIRAFVRYTIYDGSDGLIALKLLDMGVSIKPENIDWYRRMSKEQEPMILNEEEKKQTIVQNKKDPRVVYGAGKKTVKKRGKSKE